MANNKSIQILRGAVSYDPATSEEVLLDGQPFYSKKTKQLYVGEEDSSGNIQAIKDLKPITANMQSGSGKSSTQQIPDGETFSGLKVGLTENNTIDTYNSDASGQNSTILGGKNRAQAKRSTAIGGYNVAAGASSLATGEQTMTEGRCAFSTGQRTRAKGGSS